MNVSLFFKKNYVRILFALGCVLGAASFVAVYGFEVLDFSNNGWLFYWDNDLRQHYIAWCNYRNEAWHFPIGLVQSLSYPNSISIIYTDSIPLFAVLFKIIRGILPDTFQYFGLFGILSFMLMGGLSSVFLSRIVNNPVICILGSEFYVMSFTVLQRMFYHTALSAQWIIILAFLIWIDDRKIVKLRSKALIWGAMSFLCVSIHSYFLPMVGMILLALMVSQFISDYSNSKNILKALRVPACELLAFCAAGIFNLWILGGFYGKSKGYAGGLGSFGANLNTFYNPIDYGCLLKRFPLFYEFQYEGSGYLGVGIISLLTLVIVVLIAHKICGSTGIDFAKIKVSAILVLLLTLCSVLAATMPLISINDRKIIWFPYPGFVEKMLGIFRSNGRFIWVAMYLIFTLAIGLTAYIFRERKYLATIIIAAALLLQLYDGSAMYAGKHEYFAKVYPVYTMWDDPEITPITEGKTTFAFLYLDNDVTLYTAYYGYLHGMKQNNYYFARDIDDEITKGIDEYISELSEGYVREDTVYVITSEMYEKNKEFYDSLPVNMINKYDHVAFASE